MNNRLYIYDCLTGKLRASDADFMSIGKGQKNTFRIAMAEENAGTFAQRNGVCRFFPRDKDAPYSLNRETVSNSVLLEAGVLNLLVIGGGCAVLWFGEADKQPDFSIMNPRSWYAYDPEVGTWSTPMALMELASSPLADTEDALAGFEGLREYAFRLKDIADVARSLPQSNARLQNIHERRATPSGHYRCPFCWATFKRSEMLSVATHPELRGDNILGEQEMQRFQPQHMDAESFPLDSRGQRCTEQACPACHHKLPPIFGHTSQHIFSLIGVPGAGKSYYLAALIHELESLIPREFGEPFRDTSPATNEPLNNMRMRLFTAGGPEDANIGKTQLREKRYHQVWKDGAFVNMPRPFIYSLSKHEQTDSVILYDYAGESYEPGGSFAESVEAEHLKVADTLFFLFDPTTNPGFRTLLKDVDDPQLQKNLYPPGRQTQLLTATELRLRTSLNLPPGQKMTTPLAVIIGKSDSWLHLLGPEPLLPVVRNGRVRRDNVAANSARLRKLLFHISPQICTHAEAISDTVVYFAASALGKAPVEFTHEETGEKLLGPADSNLHPLHVTDAFIWALNRAEPLLLPGNDN
ncbi:MAG: hypothetical protein IKJ58_07700 [Akkermansia sp.]|nr:hypothetical protein [Akkermansia sp.]